MSETDNAPTSRSRRDPEARRRAIVRAAVELLLESGDLSHRQVAARAQVPLGSTTYYFASLSDLRAAALEQLADELNDELTEIARQVAEVNGDPRVLAGLLHAYLSDTDQARADAALYSAAAQDPALRHLALRWFNGFVHMLSEWTDEATARNIGVYVDGVSLHATLAEEPLDLPTLTRGLLALLRPLDEET